METELDTAAPRNDEDALGVPKAEAPFLVVSLRYSWKRNMVMAGLRDNGIVVENPGSSLVSIPYVETYQC